MGRLYKALNVQIPVLVVVAVYLVVSRLLVIGKEAFLLHVLANGGSMSLCIAEESISVQRFLATLVAIDVFRTVEVSGLLACSPMKTTICIVS